jgi:steroid delta-isomerase-like uncharacterized protein
MSEENKNVIRRYVEYFNAGDIDGLRSICTPDAVIQGLLGWGKIDMVLPIWKALADSLGMQLTIEDMVAERDVVAVRYTETGTARKPFFDKPATGKSYHLIAMEWFELRDGKIVRRWGARDAASQGQQLGWDAARGQPDLER